MTLIMSKDPELALGWRLMTRRIFQNYMSRGYSVEGFHASPQRAFYRLAQ